MNNGLKDAYSLGCGQCSKSMRSKIQSLPGFEQSRGDNNVIVLIKLIQGATFNFEKHTYLYYSLNNIQQKNHFFFQQWG